MLQEEETSPNGIANEAFSATEENGAVATITPTSIYPRLDGSPKSIPKILTTAPLPPSPHEDEREGCGWLSFQPKFLQRFQTSRWVLVGLVWAAAIQGMVVNGFVNVCISTIEKRYNLRSATTGLIAVSYDIGVIICCIPVSYLGSLPGASKPRWLGWGILIMGLGSFVFAMPRFTAPLYHVNQPSGESSTASLMLCLREANYSSKCQDLSNEWLSSYKYVFLLGQFLHGVGASPLYTLGSAYLDESVPMKMSSFYLGIFHAMAVIGPAAGYVIGGQLLNLYIDFPTVDPQFLGINRGSDQWLGAWWIGFVLAGVLAVSISWILLAFPAEIPGAKKRASERTGAVGYIDAEAFAHIRHLPEAAKVLLKNLPFVFLSLGEAFDALLVAGFSTFMPKVIENQFGLSAALAALSVGAIAVPAGGGGTFLGGWLIKHFKLNFTEILRLCVILSSVSFCFIFAFLTSCPEPSLAGVNIAYDNRSIYPSTTPFMASCNKNCSCEELNYDPVCGVNKIMYYSPCHAGCHSRMNFSGHQIYSDCECIPSFPLPNGIDPLELTSEGKSLPMPQSSVFRQKCPTECSYLIPFLILFLIVMLFTFLTSIPATTGTLRCVPDTHRSLALGLQSIQLRLLGSIPGPVIFGRLMDNSCTLWQTTCKGTGSCRHYNNAVMSGSLAGISLVVKACCCLSFFLSWWFYRRRNKENNEDLKTNAHSNITPINSDENHTLSFNHS